MLKYFTKNKSLIKNTCLAVLALQLSACATSSLFNPYPHQANDYIQAINTDTIAVTTEQLIDKRENADNLLYMQESGRLNQLNQSTSQSIQDFDFVIRRYTDMDDQAKISALKIGSQGVSLISNENAIAYEGKAYERIFAHLFQAFNYLSNKDIEAASVEIRRASAEQRRLELEYADEIGKAESQATDKNIKTDQWLNEPALAGMNSLASETRSSFLNAYTFYTSAVIWEAQGDLNAAIVDYKKALEIHPQSLQLIAAINRVDKPQDKSIGKLVVLYEEGFVPAKKSFKLAIPSFYYQTYFNIAFPYYDSEGWPITRALTIKNATAELGKTEVLVNVSNLAVKALKEDIPALMIRQILRARVKHEMQQQAQSQSDLGGIFATIYNIVSEQADLRSWLTLPNTAQAFYHELPVGHQTLTLQTGGRSDTIDINIMAGHTTLVRVIDSGQRIMTESFIL